MTFTQWADARMLNPIERAIALRAWRASRDITLIACQRMYTEELNTHFVPTASHENNKTN